jgi:hypothetical protein
MTMRTVEGLEGKFESGKVYDCDASLKNTA